MIKFIICEDNVDALERASQTVTKTMMKYDIEYKIYKFTKYDSKLKEQIKDEFNTKFYILDMKSINRLYNIFLFLPSLNIIIPKPNIDIINIMLAINILITSNTFS